MSGKIRTPDKTVTVTLTLAEAEATVEAFSQWNKRTHGRIGARGSVEASAWGKLAEACCEAELLTGLAEPEPDQSFTVHHRGAVSPS